MKEKFGELSHRITPCLLSDYPEFVRAMLLVKSAAARANASSGVLDLGVGNRIVDACQGLLEQEILEGLIVDPYSGGGGIVVNSNINALIAELADVESSEVNASQSTADSCASAMRIALYQLLTGLRLELERTARIMRENEQRFQHSALMARTCLQDAMPTSLGSLFQGYASLCERRGSALERVQYKLLQINLGGTVIGSGEGASDMYRALVLEILKEESSLPLERRASLYDAAQNADDLGALGHELALLAESLIKVAKDLRLLASGPQHGFGDITLPKIIPGSSFFMDKNNPTIPETVVQACLLVIGRVRSATGALEHAELNLNVFEYLAGFSLYEAMEILTNALGIWNENCLERIEVKV